METNERKNNRLTDSSALPAPVLDPKNFPAGSRSVQFKSIGGNSCSSTPEGIDGLAHDRETTTMITKHVFVSGI